MEIYLMILLITTITGVGGLTLGGGLAAAVHRPSERWVSLLLRFTAGVMLSVVCFDLMEEAVREGGILAALVWIAAGFGCTYLLNCWIDKRAHHSHDHGHVHGEDLCACGQHSLHTAGVVLAVAVALHNMPVGMAIGATFASHGTQVQGGILAALIIGLHNIPEGMSIAAPMLSGGTSRGRAIGLAAASGLPTVAGALLGYSVGAMEAAVMSAALGFAAGAMLYVVFGELLPEAEHLWRDRRSGVATMVGLLLGMVLIFSHHQH